MSETTRHARSLAMTAGFLLLAAGSDSDENSPSIPDNAGQSDVKVTEKTAGPGGAVLECKEDVSGKLGAMLTKIVEERDAKTDLQKEAFDEEIAKKWASKGYCGKVKGKIEDVGTGLTGSAIMSGCDAPSGLDGHLAIEDIDGVEYRSAMVYAPSDRVKADLAVLNKGDEVEVEIYVFGANAMLNGTVCGVLK